MPTAPEFSDEGLAEIAAAFLSRSKAITYHARGWSISRDHQELERMNIDADGFHGKLRLSVWPNREIWFRLCCGRAKDGWDFLLTFNAWADMITNEELVETFISTMANDPNESLGLWKNVSPVIERVEPST